MSVKDSILTRFSPVISNATPIKVHGKVTRVIGLVIEGYGPSTSIGDLCDIYSQNNKGSIKAEVVGFKDNKILLMPLGELRGIKPGDKIIKGENKPNIKTGEGLLGRVIDGLGEPIDHKGPLCEVEDEYPIYSEPINPLKRKRIAEPLDLGIRTINGLLTCGKGQRIGILSGTGVGKSVLMSMMARNTEADINVVGLIGERGREVKDFIEKDLREEGLKRSIVVAATSDQPPLVRIRGAFIATAIAEYFRDKGKDVLLMFDSITRFAMAQREIGLSIGEPPTTKGYTPSVFAILPKLLERGGAKEGMGSITGLYTVLVEGDDLSEPISDAVRAILDGHIVLSRSLASQNHYPAIDVLNSISRLMIDIISTEHLEMANRFKSVLATYKEAEDLINLGAYVSGSNKDIDFAIKTIDKINQYLRQGIEERVCLQESIDGIKAIFQ
ncbi:MAG TPA: flagellar protein export ATPase FliI [Nitrospinota bacterium]|nr:flagellar protein export ATPase FliI [Nitrospinota bacterium]